MLIKLKEIFQIKEKWASAFNQKQIFSCDIHCLARAEAVNHLITSNLFCKASVIELIKLIEDVD